MTGLTDFITEARWEDILLHWLVLIDDAYLALEQHFGRWRRRGPAPRFHDSEVITVGLLIDTYFGGDEAKGPAFVRQYHAAAFPHLPANSQFNQCPPPSLAAGDRANPALPGQQLWPDRARRS